jgi:hypothetical protein
LNFNRQKVLEELRAKQGAYCENTLECTVVHSRPDGFGYVSLPSFRNRRPLFSTLSIYIAKKRRLPQVYLSWQGIPTVAGSPAEAGWGPRTQVPKLTRT